MKKEWDSRLLGDFLSVKHGWAFPSEEFSDEGDYIVLTPGNFVEGGGLKLRGAKDKHYSADFPLAYMLSEGDILVVMTDLMQAAPLLGGALIVPENNRFLHNQRLGLIQTEGKCAIHRGFLYYLLNSEKYKAQVRASATGATVRHTAPSRIEKCRVHLPVDLDEQAAIAELLGSQDELISNTTQQISLLEEAARLIYTEWFVRLRFPGHEQAKSTAGVPEGWSLEPLGNRIELKYGKSMKESDRESGDIPVYGSSGIVGTHARALAQGRGIVVGRKGNVGSVYYSPQPFFPIDTVFFIDSEQTTFYLLHALQRMNFISSDAAVPGLNRSYAYSQQMLWPAEGILSQFEEKCGTLYEQINVLWQQIATLKEARDLLLPRLISGQLRL